MGNTSNYIHIQGDVEGETPVSYVGPEGFCVWNQPIGTHLACRSLEGWPRLELVVRGKDSHGRNQLAGYGSVMIPTKPVTVEMLCHCWRPAGRSLLARLRAFFIGVVPELQQNLVLCDPQASR